MSTIKQARRSNNPAANDTHWGKNKWCKCQDIDYPDGTEVKRGYMNTQYEWLEKLIALSNLAEFKAECGGGKQQTVRGREKFETAIDVACKNHPELKDSWEWNTKENGFELAISWEKSGGDCPFDCQSIFPALADDPSCKYLRIREIIVFSNERLLCVYDEGTEKNGIVKTDCGSAHFVADTSSSNPSRTSNEPRELCNGERPRWMTLERSLEVGNKFCENHVQGDKWLRRRPNNNRFSNAVIEYFYENEDPMIKVYAYLDNDCSDLAGISVNVTDCKAAINRINSTMF